MFRVLLLSFLISCGCCTETKTCRSFDSCDELGDLSCDKKCCDACVSPTESWESAYGSIVKQNGECGLRLTKRCHPTNNVMGCRREQCILSGLTFLSLSNSSFTALHSINWRFHRGIKSLYITHSGIENLGVILLEDLENLDVSNNLVTYLNKSNFERLEKLLKFYASFNKIEMISPDTFKSSKNLELIDLSHNFLFSITSASFNFLQRLRVLKLQSNRLRVIDFRFDSQRLTLSLAQNQLGDETLKKALETTNFLCSSPNGSLHLIMDNNPVGADIFLAFFMQCANSTQRILRLQMSETVYPSCHWVRALTGFLQFYDTSCTTEIPQQLKNSGKNKPSDDKEQINYKHLALGLSAATALLTLLLILLVACWCRRGKAKPPQVKLPYAKENEFRPTEDEGGQTYSTITSALSSPTGLGSGDYDALSAVPHEESNNFSHGRGSLDDPQQQRKSNTSGSSGLASFGGPSAPPLHAKPGKCAFSTSFGHNTSRSKSSDTALENDRDHSGAPLSRAHSSEPAQDQRSRWGHVTHSQQFNAVLNQAYNRSSADSSTPCSDLASHPTSPSSPKVSCASGFTSSPSMTSEQGRDVPASKHASSKKHGPATAPKPRGRSSSATRVQEKKRRWRDSTATTTTSGYQVPVGLDGSKLRTAVDVKSIRDQLLREGWASQRQSEVNSRSERTAAEHVYQSELGRLSHASSELPRRTRGSSEERVPSQRNPYDNNESNEISITNV